MDYNGVAADYDRRYALHDYPGVREAVFGVINRAGDDGVGVLELGCGTGQWLAEFERAGCRVAGVDPSAEMLRHGSLARSTKLSRKECS